MGDVRGSKRQKRPGWLEPLTAALENSEPLLVLCRSSATARAVYRFLAEQAATGDRKGFPGLRITTPTVLVAEAAPKSLVPVQEAPSTPELPNGHPWKAKLGDRPGLTSLLRQEMGRVESQWKDPKKWWKELATAQGRKDYDWSHLAARYFPKREREKCVQDPSLAVAHKCFWELHPAKAYAWELRLQDEIRPDFTIAEPNSDLHRAQFLQEHHEEVQAAQAKETQRRARKAAKGAEDEGDTPLLDGVEDPEASDA